MSHKLGMTNFQVGILFFLGILTCAIIGTASFFIFNKITNQNINFTFSNPQNKIIGKWETDNGDLYEFFPDGTVATSSFASKYSFPDKTHIKIEMGNLANVQEYALSNNELILGNQTLKKYQEFELTPQIITGTWNATGFNKNNECFKSLGIEVPQDITFGIDGSFTLTNLNLSMTGQYSINKNNLHITATGTKKSSSSSLGIYTGNVPPTPTDTPLQGEFNCTAIISNSRLTFKDNLNQSIIFKR